MPAADIIPSRTFRNIPVLPYQDLLAAPRGGAIHRGGPCYPDWDDQSWPRFLRAGVPVCSEPRQLEPGCTLREPVAWCGAVVWHFGHLARDFTTRVLPSLRLWPDGLLGFAVRRDWQPRPFDELPPALRGILAWFDVPPRQVHIFERPTLARELRVVPQGECSDRPPASWYLDLLDEHARGRIPAPRGRGALYVSRAGMTRHMAGESYLEQVLTEVGVRVIRPEAMPLMQQMEAYLGAEQVLMPDGSAMHGLQLLGHLRKPISVLARAPGRRLVEEGLKARGVQLSYGHPFRASIVGADLFRSDPLAPERSLLVGDEGKLIEFFAERDIDLRGHWSSAKFAAAVLEDLGQWLRRRLTTLNLTANSKSPGLASLAGELSAAGLADHGHALRQMLEKGRGAG